MTMLKGKALLNRIKQLEEELHVTSKPLHIEYFSAFVGDVYLLKDSDGKFIKSHEEEEASKRYQENPKPRELTAGEMFRFRDRSKRGPNYDSN